MLPKCGIQKLPVCDREQLLGILYKHTSVPISWLVLSHFLEVKSQCFWREKQWDKAHFPEKTLFCKWFFICFYTFLVLNSQFFIQVGFLLKDLILFYIAWNCLFILSGQNSLGWFHVPHGSWSWIYGLKPLETSSYLS